MMHRADMMDRLQADMHSAAAHETAMPEAVAALVVAGMALLFMK